MSDPIIDRDAIIEKAAEAAHNPSLWRSFTNDAQIIRCCGQDFGNATGRLRRGEALPAPWPAFIAHITASALLSIADDLLAPIEANHHPVEIEPSDTICRECSFQLPNGRFFGKVIEWPCPDMRVIAAIREAVRA